MSIVAAWNLELSVLLKFGKVLDPSIHAELTHSSGLPRYGPATNSLADAGLTELDGQAG